MVPNCPHRSKVATTDAQRRARRKKSAIMFLGGHCVDCHDEFPGRPEVFDFDHVGHKEFQIGSALSTHSWKRIAAELQKCELVCANCHRTRTKKRQRDHLLQEQEVRQDRKRTVV